MVVNTYMRRMESNKLLTSFDIMTGDKFVFFYSIVMPRNVDNNQI